MRHAAPAQVRLLFWVVTLAGGPLWAQSIAGDWQATLDGAKKFRVVLKISAASNGDLSANLFSIDQSATAIPVQSLSLNAQAVTFTVPRIRGSYQGKLSADGVGITGVWTQGDGDHDLNFVRATKETAWALDQSPHTASFVSVEPGVKLEVLDWGGTGRALVLLAGLGDDAHRFDQFAQKLTVKYHVYGITRRGFGASDSPLPTETNYLASRLGDDVIAVLDSLKLTRPLLVGHSIGGGELSSIGSRHPERVAGLVYLDAAYVYAFYDKASPDFAMDLLELRRKLGAILNAISPQEAKALLAEIAKDLPAFENGLKVRQKELAGAPDMSAEQIAEERKQRESRQGMSARAVLNGRQPHVGIKCPVLAIVAVPHQRRESDAAEDAKDVARVEPQVKAFQAGIPQAKIVRIAHGNHYIFNSHEGDVIREIDAFVAGLPESR